MILSIENLSVTYKRSDGQSITAVDSVSLSLNRGEILGLVGESGCGKSTLGKAIMGIEPASQGRIEFEGNLVTPLERSARPIQLRKLQLIFQDPYSSLNPRHTVGRIVEMPLVVQKINPSGGRKKKVQELLELVGLNPEHYNRYPHEFSGGQRQRIGIARAIALKPKLIVADEPVSALDVSIQAQVINLLEDLSREDNISIVFIAHDLSVVQHISDRVAVMYLGKIMEIGKSSEIFTKPTHPYTQALLSAAPKPDPKLERTRERIILKGDLPSPMNPPSGCVFRTRCWKAQSKCETEVPALVTHGSLTTACHFPQ